MTNHGMTKSYMAQAEEIYREAESMCSRGVWNLAVRRSQEVVELALKAVLRYAGVEVPHLHDVGVLLKDHLEKFNDEFNRYVDKVASISRRLRREREISFYGDDETGTSPEQIYVENDAREALEDAKFVLNICKCLLAHQAGE